MKQITTDSLKHIQLDILLDITKFCDENGLRYFLTGGTLIGAVRHQGYIPWDDDIDIAMLRDDYEVLIKNYPNNGTIRIISPETDSNYYLATAKAICTNTILKEGIANPYPLGVYIDIFPLDPVPNDYDKFTRLYEKMQRVRKIQGWKFIPSRANRKWYKKAALWMLQAVLSVKSDNEIARHINQLAQTYRDEQDSQLVAVLTTMTYGKKEAVGAECYRNTIDLPFEGFKFHVPVGYDEVLTHLYGDYMKLPPKEKQVTHHDFKAWWKESEI